MSRAQFLSEYGFQLQARYEWARNAEKLSRFLSVVSHTIESNDNHWNDCAAPSCIAAWRAIGGKGRPTLKALRGLN